jgi:general nucleoside transport system ATP-binding protein
MTYALEMLGITKRFLGVRANDRVDFRLGHGEIHALLGENGAGKSTLMNVLYGLCRPDEGRIFRNGRRVDIVRPKDAIRLGIGMVHQHFMLVPVMTVAENIILGNEVTRGPLLDLKKAVQITHQLSEQYGLAIDPKTLVRDLPVGICQRVEILKALYRNADILILDEPTAVLTPEEAESLFQTFSNLTEAGKSIIFITHKLKEVLRTAHRMTVLRNGRVVGASTPESFDEKMLASLMVGHDVSLTISKKPPQPEGTVLEVSRLTVENESGAAVVSEISFRVRAGEILGIAGVHGNGQRELVLALSGLKPSASGKVFIEGGDVTQSSPRDLFDRGVSHIPEDRHGYGMVESFSVAHNLMLNRHHQKPFSRGLVFNRKAIVQNAENLTARFDIRTPDIFSPAGSLSGGNQQRLVVAREFSRPIRLLIADHPTRGLDVGATEFIHRSILALRDGEFIIDNQGEKRAPPCAVLLISPELDEIFTLSDRIAVMYRGKFVTIVDASDVNRQSIGLWMAGIRPAPRAETPDLRTTP